MTQVVAQVVAALGERLTAVIADVADAHTLRTWIETGAVPIEAVSRLEGALAAIVQLEDVAPDEVSAWFTSMNDQLDDASPATALRSAQTVEEIAARSRDVLRAARAHLAG